jgi:hypothetical protein
VNLSAAQIAQYAANAGFTGNDLLTAVDIALAESSGNPQAYNPETAAGAPAGQGSFGLWQIFLAMHPEFAGENLYDPQTNANAAYSIYAIAGGFTPWSSYTSGVYGMYESPAVLAAVAPFGGPAPTVAPQATVPAAPLTLDAATGIPVQTAAILPGVSPSLLTAAAGEPSLTDILILGALGIAALWFIAEAA